MKDTTISLGQHGQVRGRQDDHGVCRFLGIPYALPPLGPRRWTKPGALPADHVYQDGDHQPRDCTMFGPVCAQEIYYVDGKAINELPAAVRHSEDCLNLNIWTPADPTSADGAWPVLVFIHGGWLQIGSPSVLDRDQPQELIGADGAGLQAVVVSIGYRLNVFGFLAGDGVPGNFGFWVSRPGRAGPVLPALACLVSCADKDRINARRFTGSKSTSVTLAATPAG